MQLSHYTAPALLTIILHQFWAECSLVRALSQTQESDEDVALRIFVRKERFPSTIGRVVPSQEFHGLGTDFVMDLVDLQESPYGRMWE